VGRVSWNKEKRVEEIDISISPALRGNPTKIATRKMEPTIVNNFKNCSSARKGKTLSSGFLVFGWIEYLMTGFNHNWGRRFEFLTADLTIVRRPRKTRPQWQYF
jgi:hypothetical protein